MTQKKVLEVIEEAARLGRRKVDLALEWRGVIGRMTMIISEELV